MAVIRLKGMSGRLGKHWFSWFLTFFFLYLLADTFLESGPFGAGVTFTSLALALALFFIGALGALDRNPQGGGTG